MNAKQIMFLTPILLMTTIHQLNGLTIPYVKFTVDADCIFRIFVEQGARAGIKTVRNTVSLDELSQRLENTSKPTNSHEKDKEYRIAFKGLVLWDGEMTDIVGSKLIESYTHNKSLMYDGSEGKEPSGTGSEPHESYRYYLSRRDAEIIGDGFTAYSREQFRRIFQFIGKKCQKSNYKVFSYPANMLASAYNYTQKNPLIGALVNGFSVQFTDQKIKDGASKTWDYLSQN